MRALLTAALPDGFASLQPRRGRRLVLYAVAFLAFVSFLVLLTPRNENSQWSSIAPDGGGALSATPQIERCNYNNRTKFAQVLSAAESKYAHLLDDKFTIAISTFHRPKELQCILHNLLAKKIPSLLEIVVLWNNFNDTAPEAFTSEHGVPVRYRIPPRDSLNEKLWPDPQYRTRAVLLSDDDVFYRASDLEYVFQMWRQFGRERMTGALARCALVDKKGRWEYQFCSQNDDTYAMVLTNLAFTDIAFLDYYFSDDPALTKIRNYVDDHFNCEDIALNFVASLLTNTGPLLVRGSSQYVNLDPSTGISRQSGHLEARSQCLNAFAEILSCMPLVDQMGHLERGVRHNVWYKTLWDRYGW